MLGFRSLFRTHDLPNLIELSLDELSTWVQSKRYDWDAVREGQTVAIGEGVTASLQRHTDEVGSHALRARILERTPSGTWTSELTVQSSPTGNRGWVWLDILKPDDHGWTATPRLARSLVKALPARDGAHLLNHRPMRIEPSGVDAVVASLTDPARRGLAFIGGTDHRTQFYPWKDKVSDLLIDTVGLSNAWVLSADATDRFNHLVGKTHEATPGFVRTYLPHVVPHDPLDGARHRFLTGTSIDRTPIQALRRVLGHRAREQMIASKLPEFLRDLDRILRGELDLALLDELSPRTVARVHSPAPTPVPEIVGSPEATDVSSDAVSTTQSIEFVTTATVETPAETDLPSVLQPPTQAPIATGLASLLQELIGTDEVTIESLSQLGELARAAKRAEAARVQIRTRLEDLRLEADEAKFNRDLAQEQLRFEQEERAAAEEERADAERRLRYAQKKLVEIGRAEEAWSADDIEVRDIRPESFAELLSRLDEIGYVVFTGSVETTEGLDKHGPSRSWAGKAWDALLALDDYARVRLTQSFARDVTSYLAELPSGYRGFSSNRHASTESEDVQRNPKFRRPRELPVAKAVEASGRVFMGAHFKIAQSSMISPRLHYFDAISITGKIYVGHIGPHLPTADP